MALLCASCCLSQVNPTASVCPLYLLGRVSQPDGISQWGSCQSERMQQESMGMLPLPCWGGRVGHPMVWAVGFTL